MGKRWIWTDFYRKIVGELHNAGYEIIYVCYIPKGSNNSINSTTHSHTTHLQKDEMEITLPQLQSYLFAIEQIPPFTPKRWDLISECVTKLSAPSDKIPQPTIQGPSSGEEGDFSEDLHSPASVNLV